jgi:hypothetical protein
MVEETRKGRGRVTEGMRGSRRRREKGEQGEEKEGERERGGGVGKE